jgi:hypothetical protein
LSRTLHETGQERLFPIGVGIIHCLPLAPIFTNTFRFFCFSHCSHRKKNIVTAYHNTNKPIAKYLDTGFHFYIHTYHSRFIREGVAEASQIFLETPTFYLNYLAMSNTADVQKKQVVRLLPSDRSLSQV